jgi:hypothetical protein
MKVVSGGSNTSNDHTFAALAQQEVPSMIDSND